MRLGRRGGGFTYAGFDGATRQKQMPVDESRDRMRKAGREFNS